MRHLGTTETYQDEFKRILNEEVGDYAARALALLAQAIEAKGPVLTEELLHSLLDVVSTCYLAATGTHLAATLTID